MRKRTWPMRALVLAHLLSVLPLLVAGFVCIPTDGGQLEFGACACVAGGVVTTPAAIGPSPTSSCGPCHDESFRSLRSASVTAPAAPALNPLALAPSSPPLAAPRASAHAAHACDPPDLRVSPLRC